MNKQSKAGGAGLVTMVAVVELDAQNTPTLGAPQASDLFFLALCLQSGSLLLETGATPAFQDPGPNLGQGFCCPQSNSRQEGACFI